MSTDLPSSPGSAELLEVLRRWDDASETCYSLKEATAEVGALGIEYPARAVDPGGVVRDMRVVVLSPLEASNLRGLIHDQIVALGALRNPIVGAAEATVVVDDGFGLVLPLAQGKVLEELLEGGPLPVRAAAEVALEIAWGLAASHAAVLPDQIRPMAVPHGRIDADNVVLSGLGEVVLTDYNVHAARSSGATPADDIYSLASLFVHLVAGEAMPAPPADPDAARSAVQEDLEDQAGMTAEMRSLIAAMLDPEPPRRPDIRTVARQLRQVIPHQEGLWLSAWAESVIGLPVRERPSLSMPAPTLVTAEFSPDEPEEELAESESESPPERARIEATPRLVKRGRKRPASVQVRYSIPMVIGALLMLGVLVGGGFKLARAWLDGHGVFDMADVATNQDGPDKAASAGAVATGPAAGGPTPPPSQVPSGSTVIEAEAGMSADDEKRTRDEVELAETDEAIEPDAAAEEPAADAAAEEPSADAAAEPEATAEVEADVPPVESEVVAEAPTVAAEADVAAEAEGGTDSAADVEADAEDEVADAAPEEDGEDGAAAAGDAAADIPAEDVEADAEVIADASLAPVVPTAPPVEGMVGPPPWPRPAGTLGEHDLFVEVPLANSLELRCTNGLSMRGPSPFRAAIMQSSPARCVVEAKLRDGKTARSAIRLDRTLDLICRYNYHDTLRCADRPTGRNVALPMPSDDALAQRRSDIRVRVPLALSAEVTCTEGKQESGVDIEWLELSQVAVGICNVTSTMPDGNYGGSFVVTKNAEILCLRDFAGPSDANNRRPLRCAATTVL